MPVKISKPGYNVLTETDDRNLIFNSESNHLKTFSSGSFQQTFGTAFGTAAQAVSHSLGYRPLVMAFYRNTTNSNYFMPGANLDNFYLRIGVNADVGINVDSTYAYFYLSKYAGSAGTIEVKYEIFYEGS
jgi:hypothetical protein